MLLFLLDKRRRSKFLLTQSPLAVPIESRHSVGLPVSNFQSELNFRDDILSDVAVGNDLQVIAVHLSPRIRNVTRKSISMFQ